MMVMELVIVGGYDSYVFVNSQYGVLGWKLVEELEWNLFEFKGVLMWIFVFVMGVDGDICVDMEVMGYE